MVDAALWVLLYETLSFFEIFSFNHFDYDQLSVGFACYDGKMIVVKQPDCV